MNLKLKSCKSDAQSMTLTVVDGDTGREASAFITTRTCGGPFLLHDASVGSLVSELLDAVNALTPVVPAPDAVEAPGAEPAVENVVAAPRKGKTLPPKGAA